MWNYIIFAFCLSFLVNSEGKSTTSATTKSQDSSVLDTLATLATATLSHTASSTSTTPQQVTAVPGRPIGIAPLTLPPTTPTLTTPLTPSSLFPMPSPLAALSALSSLSSPAQTSPLPLSFSMPVMTPQQVSTSGTQLLPLVQPGGTPFFSNAAGLSIQVPTSATTVGDITSSSATSSGVAIAGAETGVKCVTLNTGTTPVPNTAAHTVIPQTVMSPFQLSNSSGQALIQTQLALTQMLAPTQGVQPSVVLEMNATTNKDGVGEKYVFPPSYHEIIVFSIEVFGYQPNHKKGLSKNSFSFIISSTLVFISGVYCKTFQYFNLTHGFYCATHPTPIICQVALITHVVHVHLSCGY